MPARPAESPRHERVFIIFGGPQGHGDSPEDAVSCSARAHACRVEVHLDA
jgi:hypothetical protein